MAHSAFLLDQHHWKFSYPAQHGVGKHRALTDGRSKERTQERLLKTWSLPSGRNQHKT